jgi:hypothetical protein
MQRLAAQPLQQVWAERLDADAFIQQVEHPPLKRNLEKVGVKARSRNHSLGAARSALDRRSLCRQSRQQQLCRNPAGVQLMADRSQRNKPSQTQKPCERACLWCEDLNE